MIRKEDKMAQSRRDEAVINKIFVWFLSAVVLEALLFLVNRFYINARVTDTGVAIMMAISYVVKVVPFVGVIAAALLAIRGLTFHKQGKPAGKYGVASVLALVVAFCSAVIWRFFDVGVRFLYVAVPVIAVLALIYYLYQREFFFSTFISALGVLGLWLVRKGYAVTHGTILYVYLAVTVVIAVLIAVLAARAKGKKGMLSLGGQQVKLFSAKANYIVIWISCVLACAAFALGLVLGSVAAFYLLIVLAVWLVALLAYHTVRLM